MRDQAETLYGANKAPEPQRPAPDGPSQPSASDILYGRKPAGDAPEEPHAADVLYPATSDKAARMAYSEANIALARMEGDVRNAYGEDRGEEFEMARHGLLRDLDDYGTDPALVTEATKILNAARYSGTPPEEQEATAWAELGTVWGADVPANLSAARRMVDHIESRSPGFKGTLNATGAGNSPKLIMMLADEAKRRGL